MGSTDGAAMSTLDPKGYTGFIHILVVAGPHLCWISIPFQEFSLWFPVFLPHHLEEQGWHGRLVRDLVARGPEFDSQILPSCFDFFPFQCSLNSLKYPHKGALMEGGGGGGGGGVGFVS